MPSEVSVKCIDPSELKDLGLVGPMGSLLGEEGQQAQVMHFVFPMRHSNASQYFIQAFPRKMVL